jgi:hypothetical protein
MAGSASFTYCPDERHRVGLGVARELGTVGHEVVLAKGRGDVDDAGAGVERDEIGGEHPPVGRDRSASSQRHLPLEQARRKRVERRTVTPAHELRALHPPHHG